MIELFQELKAIAQTGLAYTKDPYDRKRYERLQILIFQLLESHLATKPQNLNDIFFEEKGYQTPKVDVRGSVFSGNKILLVKERSDKKWTLPGGWADINESPSQSVIREIEEETGLKVDVVKLVAVHDINIHQPKQFYHAYKLIFLCEIKGGQLRKSLETEDVKFHGIDKLPELSTRRINSYQIELCYKHQEHRDLPTEID